MHAGKVFDKKESFYLFLCLNKLECTAKHLSVRESLDWLVDRPFIFLLYLEKALTIIRQVVMIITLGDEKDAFVFESQRSRSLGITT